MAKKICPLIQKECLEHGCEFYTHVMGQEPQTGKLVDQWDCAVKWLPVLLVEVASKTRQNSVALESLRNESVGVLKGVGDIMARRLEQLETSPSLPDRSLRSSGDDKRPIP